MASFLLPSSIQKRLLRYALSRLELLDTDALDLEHLDISWGTKSTLEFRDVGLQLKKLTNLLKLPSKIDLVKARILLLRVTIPVDIHNSPIIVEIESVEAHVRVISELNPSNTSPRSPTNHDRDRNKQEGRNRKLGTEGGGSDSALPTATDLATSFLQTEPPEEKAELEAAISTQSQLLTASVAYSEDGEEEYETGTGTGLSLPTFMANFLKGIVDRLQVRVHGVTLDMDVDISGENIARLDSPSSPETVTLQLKIDDVDIEGVTSGISAIVEEGIQFTSTRKVIHKDGKRQISLSNLRGALISEPSLFTSMARSSTLTSPSAAHSHLSETCGEQLEVPLVAHSIFDATGGGSELKESVLSVEPSSSQTSNSHYSLSSSVIASDSGRFDDAIEDDGYTDAESHPFDTAVTSGNSYLEESAYLNQVIDSQIAEEWGENDGKDHGPPFAFPGRGSGHLSDASRKRSPLSTPRASMYIPPASGPSHSYCDNSPSSFANPPTHSQSTMLSMRPRPKFADGSALQSQILEDPPPAPVDKQVGSRLVNANCSQESSSGSDDADDMGDSTPLGEADLAQSMIFSHEDAESMYMSALSQGSMSAKVPGAWESSNANTGELHPSSKSPASQRSPHTFPDNLEHALQKSASENAIDVSRTAEDTAASRRTTLTDSQPKLDGTSPESPSQHDTAMPPKPSTPSKSSTQSSLSSDEYARVAKQLFNLDHITIYLPSDDVSSMTEAQAELSSSNYGKPVDISYSMSPDVPGAFSIHARRTSGTSTRPVASMNKRPAFTTNEDPSLIEVMMGSLRAQFDISVGRLIARLFSIISDAVTTDKSVSESPQDKPDSPLFALKFRADRISLKFLERLAATTTSSGLSTIDVAWVKPPSTDVLLRSTMKGLDINVDASKGLTKTVITLQKFILGYAKENIVSFDADLRMRSSTRDLPPTAGVDLTINITRSLASSHVKISTLPIHVSIDLQRLDETFSWFGGLSSVLNMGSSMASNATVTVASPSKPNPKPRGVRFEAPNDSDQDLQQGKNRVDARIGGFILDLVGKECSIGLDTTAVKIINREELLALSIDKIKLSGPHINLARREPAILAEVNVTRVEFLAIPKNDDLDRLLSLITPSKAKYDLDDDILLDTLLRQRRQGSVLRVTIDGVKTRLSNIEDLKYLPELGKEVSKLSTVAKYLPEDDRPGLLSLVLVRDMDFQVDAKDTLGSFHLRAAGLEVAHITFPALIALSINAITIHRNGKEEILGAATDAELREPKNRSPAVMARIIGDEMEPVVKVKFWNLRAEYSVSLLVALLGLSDSATTEEVAASIAASVATLTDHARPTLLPSSPKEVNKKLSRSPESKAMMVDIGLRECILALNPSGLPSKILVVMTDAHVMAVLPKDKDTSATLELSKGSLLVIDDIANILPVGASKTRRQSFDGGSSQVADLCSAGFVSVSYISSAKIVIQITGAKDSEDKYIDIELRDDLLVLESCADSTQTLIAALNGLKPPTPPPSKELKYRTKVIPVQDLLASLSGDAFGTAEGNYDFDEDFGPDLHKDVGDEAEDEASELDFNSRYYQEEDIIEHHENNGDYDESRQGSVLFDQLESRDTSDGVLLESFREQEKVHVAEELHFKEDHFGTGSMLEGTAHRWNSAKNTYDKSNDDKVRRGPLKVCVRDVHIIWNLFDGYDWQHTRDVISKAVQDVESKAIEHRARNDHRPTFDQDIDEEETVIGDFLFNSIYIGIPANRDPRELAIAINHELNDNATETESIATTSLSASPSRQGNPSRNRGKKLRLRRSKHHKITFELKGVNVDLVVFPAGSGETESSVDIRVHDFDIFDHVPTSTWKKFATYMRDAGERESGSSQIHLEILTVRPLPELAASEIVLKATVLPLRLHVDQDALDFITRFFEFKDDSVPTQPSQGDVPFLQRVEVNSIPVKLDFKPKRVDYAGLRSGHTTEFMNFLILDEADMVLRHTIIYGVSGFDKLGKCLNDIWMPDVKRNQLPGILAGLAPVRSLANVGSGVRDLVVVPMREYRKDGRVVRSISKGAIAFARTTGTELVKLGAKLAVGTQTVLQGAEEFLSKPNTRESSTAWDEDELDEEEKKQISLYADQPIGVIQGLRGGYASLERDLLMARDAIIAVPGEVMESGTAQGAARAVLRRAPTVILRPVIGASKAIGQTLMGATNSLDPQNRRRVEDKYKKH